MIWKGIQQLITLKNKKNDNLNVSSVKGNDVINPKNIASAYNIFFIVIGPSLSKTIAQSKKKFNFFLKKLLIKFICT